MSRRRLLAGLLACMAVACALPIGTACAAGGPLAISQVATRADRASVSLLNRSAQDLSLSDLSLQWRAAGAPGWSSVASLPDVTLPGGASYTIGFGDPRSDPAPQKADMLSLGLFLSSAGTLAIVRGGVLLACSSSAECHTEDRIADLVAFGGASIAEDAALAAPAPDPPGAVARKLGGCQDDDSNSSDLAVVPDATPVTLQSGVVTSCAAVASFQPPTAECGGRGALAVPAGRRAARTVTASDPDDRVTEFAVSLAPNGVASVESVSPAQAPGQTATAQIVMPADAAPGTFTATVTAASGGGLQTAKCTFSINVAAPAAVSGATTSTCTVPNVRNLTLAKARSRLKAKGCVAGKVKKPKGSSKGLVVRRQSRKAGSKVKRGTKVNLTLARKKK